VLDRLDKYSSVAEAPRPYDGDARERLLAKLDRAAARYGIVAPPDVTPAGAAAVRASDAINLEEVGFGIWRRYKSLKSYKTAKTFLGKAWHWNHTSLEKLGQKAWQVRSAARPSPLRTRRTTSTMTTGRAPASQIARAAANTSSA
jgi:hypothetical protein